MVIVRIVVVLAVIVLLLRRRVPISVAMLAGAVALGLLFPTSPGSFAEAVWRAATDARTVDLLVVVALILILSHLLQESGQFQRMMDSLGGMVRNARVRLATMPALIGLLPMPGGARFSAPMVEAAGKGLALDVHQLSLINYWFRHIWEYSWPLYPGFLMASTFVEGGIATLLVAQFPFTIVAVVVGALFVFPRNLPVHGGELQGSRHVVAKRPIAKINVSRSTARIQFH